MSESQFFNRFYQLCRKHGTSPNAVGREVGASSGSITAWKQGVMPRASMVSTLAEYFGVTTDYLMGYSDCPVTMTKQELKFALFGGDQPITDEMLDEVLQFAEFIKTRKK
jgi:transcriptional regulator with XRE-family HTH domain